MRLMEDGGARPVVLTSASPTLPPDVRRLVVFLPESPVRLLSTLKRAAMLLEQSATPLPMLFLSRSPASWLWSTLLHQVAERRQLSAVRAAASDLPVTVWRRYCATSYPRDILPLNSWQMKKRGHWVSALPG